MNEDVKNNGKLCYNKAHRADWKWKACEKHRQKMHTWISEFFFLLSMWLFNACIMIRVRKLQNSKHFNLVQNHQDILNVTWSYEGLHPGTPAQNSSQIPVRTQGFVGSHPILAAWWFIPTTRCAQPLIQNHTEVIKKVVPLLGCCSDAPGSRGNRLVIWGDRTSSLK